MSILSIHNVTFNHAIGTCQVDALVEDMCLIRRETREEPAEWAPGLCRASFVFNDDLLIPEDESQFIDILDDLNLDWQLLQPEG
jgi:hypothetical protein